MSPAFSSALSSRFPLALLGMGAGAPPTSPALHGACWPQPEHPVLMKYLVLPCTSASASVLAPCAGVNAMCPHTAFSFCTLICSPLLMTPGLTTALHLQDCTPSSLGLSVQAPDLLGPLSTAMAGSPWGLLLFHAGMGQEK